MSETLIVIRLATDVDDQDLIDGLAKVVEADGLGEVLDAVVVSNELLGAAIERALSEAGLIPGVARMLGEVAAVAASPAADPNQLSLLEVTA